MPFVFYLSSLCARLSCWTEVSLAFITGWQTGTHCPRKPWPGDPEGPWRALEVEPWRSSPGNKIPWNGEQCVGEVTEVKVLGEETDRLAGRDRERVTWAFSIKRLSWLQLGMWNLAWQKKHGFGLGFSSHLAWRAGLNKWVNPLCSSPFKWASL